ncbi:MAG: MBL fold metallo-hydrolase [Candidatus Methanoplasma sp.]|nr:MBL fold metallo-hydrolase [Candidatus Methanoplasma sp.]
MKAKILCVYDEGAVPRTPLIGAKGFSVLVEAGGKRILFDAGRRGKYLTHNMGHLGVPPDSIDCLVASHGHRDHVGGLADLLRSRTSPLKIFAPKSAIGTKTLLGHKGLYVPPDLSDMAEIEHVSDWTDVGGGVHASPPMSYDCGQECFIALDAADGPAVVSARSRFGVDAAMDTVRERFGRHPKTYVGGVRAGGGGSEPRPLSEVFSSYGCDRLYLNGCTGAAGITRLRSSLGLKGVSDFYAGESFELEI